MDDVPPSTGSPEQAPSYPGTPSGRGLRAPLLFITVLIIATCGLIYELIAGALASYLLGDSITQFSTIIGVYLSAMGLGSYLSKFITRGLAHRFVDVELAVALVGGLSAPLLFLAFGYSMHFRLILYGLVLVIGTLVGLEIPLLLRILKHELAFKDLVAQVLTFDYIGALLASLMFPILLVPHLGLVRTSLVFGLLNAGVGLWSTWLLKSQLGSVRLLRSKAALAITVLLVGLFNADSFSRWMETQFYAGEIIFARTSPYQRIVITRDKRNFSLYLNGNLQFSSSDEYRYHEALVHPAMAAHDAPERILIVGGGDGLALRELLTYPDVRTITIVDLDPTITELASSLSLFTELNHHSFQDPRVTVINDDAMVWLETRGPEVAPFDVALVDFPDPNNYALGKLYTTRFYRLLQEVLAPNARVAIQSTSPLFARKSYWCIAQTMEAAGFYIRPYHLSVPTFGVWGFVLAALEPFPRPTRVKKGLRYLNEDALQAMFLFPRDIERVPTEVNRLNNQVLVSIYDAEWKRWF